MSDLSRYLSEISRLMLLSDRLQKIQRGAVPTFGVNFVLHWIGCQLFGKNYAAKSYVNVI